MDEENEIGAGSFGRCYPGHYREEFNILVKVINAKDSSFAERERAKHEVIYEVTVILRVGDHPRIPYLFGVCSEQSPVCLVLQLYTVEGHSTTPSKAVRTGIIPTEADCVNALQKTCNALMFLLNRGYLHGNLKGNNVVIAGSTHKPVIIDFGKSQEIAKAIWPKPKVNFEKARKHYPRDASELHRGERPSIASNIFSFGALILKVLEDRGFQIFSVKDIAERCMSTTPAKRPELSKVIKS